MIWLMRGERIYDDAGRCLVLANRDFAGKSTRWEKTDFTFIEADFDCREDRAAINREVSKLRDAAMKHDDISTDWIA